MWLFLVCAGGMLWDGDGQASHRDTGMATALLADGSRHWSVLGMTLQHPCMGLCSSQLGQLPQPLLPVPGHLVLADLPLCLLG